MLCGIALQIKTYAVFEGGMAGCRIVADRDLGAESDKAGLRATQRSSVDGLKTFVRQRDLQLRDKPTRTEADAEYHITLIVTRG